MDDPGVSLLEVQGFSWRTGPYRLPFDEEGDFFFLLPRHSRPGIFFTVWAAGGKSSLRGDLSKDDRFVDVPFFDRNAVSPRAAPEISAPRRLRSSETREFGGTVDREVEFWILLSRCAEARPASSFFFFFFLSKLCDAWLARGDLGHNPG